MRLRWVLALVGVPLYVAAQTCGPGNKCPGDAPCCSVSGECGSGAVQCAAGCNPRFSFSPVSCAPNPVCANLDQDIPRDAYNEEKVFVPIETFHGDPNQGVFLFESGYLGQGGQGVLFETNEGHASRVSTSRYMLYGTIEATLRHDAHKGLITTFGTLSDIGDAIVWQFGSSNKSQASVNYYALNNQTNVGGYHPNLPHNYSVERFHKYGIQWDDKGIRWTLDDKPVYSVSRQQAGGQFPRSPSRVLFTVWGATSSTRKDLRKWAGGAVSYKTNSFANTGYYAQELSHLKIQCADLKMSNVSLTGTGSGPTSYIYTSRVSANSHEPEFSLSRDQIRLIPHPAEDGPEDAPGSPKLSSDGPRTNMYAGGTRNAHGSSSSQSDDSQADSDDDDDSDDATSTKVKIGVPVGIGGAVLFGALVLLSLYMVRRFRKPQPVDMSENPFAPPLGIHSPPPHASPARDISGGMMSPMRAPVMQPTPSAASFAAPYQQQQQPQQPLPTPPHEAQAPYPPETTINMQPQDDSHLENKSWSTNEYEEPPSEGSRTSSDSHSSDSDNAPYRAHLHYASRRSRGYHSGLTDEQNEELAAHAAWNALRAAALGDNEDDSFYHARSTSLPPTYSAGPTRSTYSRRGAHVPSTSTYRSPSAEQPDAQAYRSYASHARRRSLFPPDEF